MRASGSSVSCKQSALWGHLVVMPTGSNDVEAFPIDADEASRVRHALLSNQADEWVIVSALNNRRICLCPELVDSTYLVDDGAEWPDGTGKPEFPLDDYAGHPKEVYRGLAAWIDDREALDAKYPSQTRAVVRGIIEAGGFSLQPEKLDNALRKTSIYYADGRIVRYEANPEHLVEIIDTVEGEAGNGVVEIADSEGNFEAFYALRKLAMIVIPELQIEGFGF